jgi:hypothetical protein
VRVAVWCGEGHDNVADHSKTSPPKREVCILFLRYRLVFTEITAAVRNRNGTE